jgi:HlyD family secretion protein
MARLALILAIALSAGCSQPQLRTFSGRAQGDYVQVSVPLSGSVARFNVRRGETVRRGELLFSLDSSGDTAAQLEARQQVDLARAFLENARQKGRAEEIQAARSALELAQARLNQLQWRLEQAIARAPSDGVIVDIPFVEGQWVEAGLGVVSLLSPESVKVQFYVPAQVAGSLRHGQVVGLRCPRCARIPGEIVYVSPIARLGENASPGQLQFLVEARPLPELALRLRPGEPVEIVL